MSTAAFLDQLHTLGVEISAQGDRLRINAPKGALTPALTAELQSRKAEILASLRPGPSPSGESGPAPLSFNQLRLWFLHQMEPESAAYNIAQALCVSGPVDISALQAAFREVARRQGALRTTFAAADGEPVQVVAAAADLPLPVVDLRLLRADARQAEAERLAAAEARRPFDLAGGPLARVILLRLADQEHRLLLALHHIVADGWSLAVLVREMGALYDAFSQGRPSPLPELPLQYADFARWQRRWLRGATLDRQLADWTQRLAGMPGVLELPTDRPRPPVFSYRGASEPVASSRALAEGVRGLGRRLGATSFAVLLTAFQVLLRRYTGREDLPVGTPIAYRNWPEVQGLVGFFASMLVLRGDLAGDPTFEELVARTRKTLAEAFDHQDVPFEKLVEELCPERSLSCSPIFQVAFSHQGDALPGERCGGRGMGLAFTPVRARSGSARFDLTLFLGDGGEGLVGSLEYSTDLFDRPTILRLWGHLEALLKGATAGSGRRISELPLLSAGERFQAVAEWNDTQGGFSEEACLHDLFEVQAERTPGAPAVVCGDRTLTYAELDRRAGQLASHLAALGAGPGSLVAVCLDRSPEMVVAVLGVLKSGAAYVPFDTPYPDDRISRILSMLGVRQMVTAAAQRPRIERILPGTAVADIVWLDGEAPVLDGARGWDRSHLDRLPALGTGRRAEANDLAYIIFTSGTTGAPKGVVIRHRPAVNLVEWVNRTCAVGPGDRMLFITSLCFDLSVYDIFGILAAGGSVRVATDAELRDPEALLRILLDEPITFWDSAPAALQQIVPFLPVRPAPGSADLRLIFLSGDWVPVTLPDRLRRVFPGARVIALGGATEATVWSNFHPVGEVDPAWPSIPYGRPILNARYHVLDAGLEPCPSGVAGDLYIGGRCLSAGYIQEPVLTASKYVPDPFTAFAGRPGDRLYRTGDRARRWPDGTIEFLGRLDHQVKIRGFRVELGEIESVLGRHPGVREAAVLAREGAGGHKQLAAYVVPHRGAVVAVSDLRDHLAGHLPEYMVPASWVTLAALPMTANGKVDRKALPEPEVQAAPRAATAAPLTPFQELLAGIWAEVLGLEAVDLHQSFFDLGGHSLLATQVIARVRQALGLDLPLRLLFEAPTVARFAAVVEAERRDETPAVLPLEPAPRTGSLPVSFAQQRLWFLDQMRPGSPVFNIPLALRIRGELDTVALRESLGELVRRHESLRTVFGDIAGQPSQVIRPPAPVPLPEVDLTGLPGHAREAEEHRLTAREALRPFDLASGPVLRATLLALEPHEHALLLTLHHIASDGWSMGILVREVAALYEAFRAGQPSPLAALPVQYADFATWQRAWLQDEVLERHLAYWRRELAGAPSDLPLATDHPAPPVASQRGAVHTWGLADSLAAGLGRLARSAGCTSSMVLLAVFQTLLHRYSGLDDITVGVPVAGRDRLETEGLIGLFVNTLVLRSGLSGDPEISTLVRRVRERMLDAHAHQALPFEKLVEELRPERSLSQGPLFQLLFAPVEAAREPLELPGLTFAPAGVPSQTAKVPLALAVTRGAERLAASFTYATDLFDSATVERLARHLTTLLDGAAAAPDRRLSELPLLDEGERRQLLVEWSHGPAVAAEPACIHERVERWACETPGALAVLLGEHRLAYGELDRLAGRLAAVLRGLEVAPETRVGLCVERSLEMVVGLLAIAKAGGVYVPVDPAYPEERKAWMLEDARVAVLLTQERLRAALPATRARIVSLDGDPEALPQGRESGPAATPGNAAYVIYTSGSTGRPKGVVVEHRGLPNLAAAQGCAFDVRPGDRVLQLASPSFDASVSEVWVTLSAGATLVLAPRETLLPGPELIALLRGQAVTHVTLPPASLAMLPPACLPDLRTLVVAGEACPPDLARRWSAGRRFINAYGPTEATVCATLAAAPEGSIRLPIGRPMDGVRTLLLDRTGRPVPAGAAGELHIGGVGLARGYLDRPALTAERFVPDPFGAPGERLYRTGDLARFLPGGEIDFLGRIDGQVKVRGVRIEPGEIEAVLAGHPAVQGAVVVVRDDSPGGRRLTAFVVPAAGAAVPAAEIRELARRRLPDFMVPAAFVTLEAFPATPAGKIDRRALAALPVEAQVGAASYSPPTSAVEEAIVEVWQEVLGVERVGVHDNFFDLGGHSLALVQVQRRLCERLAREVAVMDLFRAPTVAALSRHLAGEGAAAGAAARQGDDRADARREMRERRRRRFESRSTRSEMGAKDV